MAGKAADPYDKSWIISRHPQAVWRFELPQRNEPENVPDYATVGTRPLMVTRITEKDIGKSGRTVRLIVAVMEEGERKTTLLNETLGVTGTGNDFETVAVEFIPVSTSDFPDITFLQHALPHKGDAYYMPGAPDLRRWIYSQDDGIYIRGPQ